MSETIRRLQDNGFGWLWILFQVLFLELLGQFGRTIRHAKLQVRKVGNSLSVDFPQSQSSSNILYISAVFVLFTIFYHFNIHERKFDVSGCIRMYRPSFFNQKSHPIHPDTLRYVPIHPDTWCFLFFWGFLSILFAYFF